MIRLVAGDTGEGKTKELINMSNESLKSTKGHIVYIDLDSSHMYDLRHEIRYINISDYPPIDNHHEFFLDLCVVSYLKTAILVKSMQMVYYVKLILMRSQNLTNWSKKTQSSIRQIRCTICI